MWRHGAGRLLRRHDDEWAKLPFAVEQVQTDNGQEFGQAFHWHLLDKGLGHIRIKPRTPPLNGKVERSQRIDFAWQARSSTTSTSSPANCRSGGLLQLPRPHGALADQTPYERLRQNAQDPLS
ncbi:hypothetical protein ABZ890_42405 [Streptomyces sp. NPDC046984]|uniref:hypothetical protein n=1 Tax=Streptomyces sp. NPDC046984 TaxID=3155138 RepID=UPI0033DE5C36